MKKILFWLLVLVCVGVMGYAGYHLYSVQHAYSVGERLYEGIAEDCTEEADTAPQSAEDNELHPPIKVNFKKLLKQNPDIVGWIYCEDTIINYPIVQTDNNEFYLHHTIDREYNFNGSIFVDCHNSRDFADANTIIYGHNMKNGTMFAYLSKFAEKGYYKKHPVMWLLTPKQNYQIVLFAGYTTDSYSETYTIYPKVGQHLKKYIDRSIKLSDFKSKQKPTGKGRLVVLSTCSYDFSGARYALHGALIPAGESVVKKDGGSSKKGKKSKK